MNHFYLLENPENLLYILSIAVTKNSQRQYKKNIAIYNDKKCLLKRHKIHNSLLNTNNSIFIIMYFFYLASILSIKITISILIN